MTLYHCRRPMPGLAARSEGVRVVVPATDTRFMVMGPGGENARPDLNPSEMTVGIRIHRQSDALLPIWVLRGRLFQYEDHHVLGSRNPSTMRTSAFGARSFQPHMSLLKPGSGICRDLTVVGERFRARMGSLSFDAFVVDIDEKWD